MKQYFFLSIILLMSICATSFAQNQNDTLRTRVRMAELTVQRTQLKQRIAVEDKKRNSQVAGVTPEHMELINLRQDSICLVLRSQLTEVELEIKELASFNQNHSSATPSRPQSAASAQQIMQALKPNKPGKKVARARK